MVLSRVAGPLTAIAQRQKKWLRCVRARVRHYLDRSGHLLLSLHPGVCRSPYQGQSRPLQRRNNLCGVCSHAYVCHFVMTAVIVESMTRHIHIPITKSPVVPGRSRTRSAKTFRAPRCGAWLEVLPRISLRYLSLILCTLWFDSNPYIR